MRQVAYKTFDAKQVQTLRRDRPRRSARDDSQAVSVRIARQRTGNKPEGELAHVDRTGRDEGDAMVAGKPEQRIRPVGHNGCLPVRKIIRTQIHRGGTAVAGCEVFEQLNPWPLLRSEGRDPETSAEHI